MGHIEDSAKAWDLVLNPSGAACKHVLVVDNTSRAVLEVLHETDLFSGTSPRALMQTESSRVRDLKLVAERRSCKSAAELKDALQALREGR